MDFFELEVVSEFADRLLVLAMFIEKILAVNTRKSTSLCVERKIR